METPNNEERADALICAWVTPSLKQRIQRAADLKGLEMTAYVLSTVVADADKTIHDHEFMELSHRDTEKFAVAILNPPAPNDHLLAAVKRYKEKSTK